MIKEFKFLIILILCLKSGTLLAQHNEKIIELSRLSIERKSFLTILDSIITHEKKCSYYECDLLFSIDLKKNKEDFLISIESQNNINLLLPLGSYGYFYYLKHLFIVRGDRSEDVFLTCKEKTLFKYLDYNHSVFQPKDGKEKLIYIFNDDSFSQWHYRFVNKDFVLEEKSTSCN
jgi:hypothetical protein